MEIRGRRGKQITGDLKETTGYWKLKDEALVVENSHWNRLRTCRKTDCGMNKIKY